MFRRLLYINQGSYLDIPDIINNFFDENVKVSVYEFKGTWFDVEQLSDYERAVEIINEDKSFL